LRFALLAVIRSQAPRKQDAGYFDPSQGVKVSRVRIRAGCGAGCSAAARSSCCYLGWPAAGQDSGSLYTSWRGQRSTITALSRVAPAGFAGRRARPRRFLLLSGGGASDSVRDGAELAGAGDVRCGLCREVRAWPGGVADRGRLVWRGRGLCGRWFWLPRGRRARNRDRRASLFLHDRLAITSVYQECLVTGENQRRGS
jgi:hypothetical protein